MEKEIYVDTLNKTKADEYNDSKRSFIKHNNVEIEMDKHHDYEEVEFTKGNSETSQQNAGIGRLKCIMCLLAVLIIVIFATFISLAVIFYLQKSPGKSLLIFVRVLLIRNLYKIIMR